MLCNFKTLGSKQSYEILSTVAGAGSSEEPIEIPASITI